MQMFYLKLQMTNRQLAQLVSALEAWCFEVEVSLDLFFKQRPFLESRTAELMINLDSTEQMESQLKQSRMLENILRIWKEIHEKKVQVAGDVYQVPISKTFLEEIKIFEDIMDKPL